MNYQKEKASQQRKAHKQSLPIHDEANIIEEGPPKTPTVSAFMDMPTTDIYYLLYPLSPLNWTR